MGDRSPLCDFLFPSNVVHTIATSRLASESLQSMHVLQTSRSLWFSLTKLICTPSRSVSSTNIINSAHRQESPRTPPSDQEPNPSPTTPSPEPTDAEPVGVPSESARTKLTKTENFYLHRKFLQTRLSDEMTGGEFTGVMSADLLETLISASSPRISPTHSPFPPSFVLPLAQETEAGPASECPVLMPSSSAPRWCKLVYELIFTEYEYPF